MMSLKYTFVEFRFVGYEPAGHYHIWCCREVTSYLKREGLDAIKKGMRMLHQTLGLNSWTRYPVQERIKPPKQCKEDGMSDARA